MKRYFLIKRCFLLVFCLSTGNAGADIKLPDISDEPLYILGIGPRAVLVQYFEASKKGDAKTATSLIDYDEWAKDMRLEGNAAKTWIESHKTSLEQTYNQHKTEGSTKEYSILSSKIGVREAEFEVSQERAFGEYIWQVKMRHKDGKWRIVAFNLQRIKGDGGGMGNVIIFD